MNLLRPLAALVLTGLCASCSVPSHPAASQEMARDTWSDVPLDSSLRDGTTKLAEERIIPLQDRQRQGAIGRLESRKFLKLSRAQAEELAGHPLETGSRFTPVLVRAVKSNEAGHFMAAQGPGYLIVAYEHLGPDRPQRWPLIVLCDKNASFSRLYVDESGGM